MTKDYSPYLKVLEGLKIHKNNPVTNKIKLQFKTDCISEHKEVFNYTNLLDKEGIPIEDRSVVFGGFEFTNRGFTALGGGTGVGKSTVAISIGADVVLLGGTTFFISGEESIDVILVKFFIGFLGKSSEYSRLSVYINRQYEATKESIYFYDLMVRLIHLDKQAEHEVYDKEFLKLLKQAIIEFTKHQYNEKIILKNRLNKGESLETLLIKTFLEASQIEGDVIIIIDYFQKFYSGDGGEADLRKTASLLDTLTQSAKVFCLLLFQTSKDFVQGDSINAVKDCKSMADSSVVFYNLSKDKEGVLNAKCFKHRFKQLDSNPNRINANHRWFDMSMQTR